MNPTLPVGGTARGATTRRVDRVNKKIVSMLQVDGRKSFVELARETGISEAAARARVHRLRLDRVIQIVAVTDPLQLGFKHEAMVAVQLNTDAEVWQTVSPTSTRSTSSSWSRLLRYPPRRRCPQ